MENTPSTDPNQSLLTFSGPTFRGGHPIWTIKTKDGRYLCPNCRKTRSGKPLPDCPDQHKRAFEIIKKKTGKWDKTHREAARARSRRNVLRKYGLTLAEADAMLKAQDGKCAICSRPIADYVTTTTGRRLRLYYVDHDHRTNAVRSLLCAKCNPLIGYADENPAILAAAIAYLAKWKEVRPLSSKA